VVETLIFFILILNVGKTIDNEIHYN
jgi:hypothetical protein